MENLIPPISTNYKMAKVKSEIEQIDNWMTYEKSSYQARILYDAKCNSLLHINWTQRNAYLDKTVLGGKNE